MKTRALIHFIFVASVFVFLVLQTASAQDATLAASDGTDNDRFGYSVDIDGSIAIVSAPFADSGKGAAYIFVRSATNWVQQAKLTASDGENGDHFGWVVAINGDRVVVGAPDDDIDTKSHQGSAYIFGRTTSGNWIQIKKLTASDGNGNDHFGSDVDIDGDNIIVGAFHFNALNFERLGSGYIFKDLTLGWTEKQKLINPNYPVEYPHVEMKVSVAISGENAVIGSYYAKYEGSAGNTESNSEGSAAYLYSEDNGNWSVSQQLASSSTPGDDLGYDVDIDEDRAIVSAFKTTFALPNYQAKAVYVFDKEGTIWNEKAKLSKPGSAGQPAFFGWRIAIEDNTILVGAWNYYSQPGANLERSSTYIYKRSVYNGFWFIKQQLFNNDDEYNDRYTFGFDVGISGNYAIVGANRAGEQYSTFQPGLAFIYDDSPPFWKPKTLYQPKFKIILDTDWIPDLLVYTGGEWEMKLSGGGTETIQLGDEVSIPVPADYDGDGIVDLAVFDDGLWQIRSSGGELTEIEFGGRGDSPMAGYFDSDEIADLAVFRDGEWNLLLSREGSRSFELGNSASQPYAGDYDGDGIFDLSVFQAGTWQWISSITGRVETLRIGQRGDLPVAEDFDGDGIADLGVFRQGTWIVQNSREGYQTVRFGAFGDIPVPNDYDNDGKADVAVFRNGIWMLQQSSAGFAEVEFGNRDGVPLSGQ